MNTISEEILNRLREEYPSGTRIELVSMTDPYVTIEPGTKGTVSWIDDIGTIHVHWDTGFSLGVVFGEDIIKKVED